MIRKIYNKMGNKEANTIISGQKIKFIFSSSEDLRDWEKQRNWLIINWKNNGRELEWYEMTNPPENKRFSH